MIKTEIREWLERGKTKKATHVVVKSDDFSHEYYPLFCYSKEQAEAQARTNDNMQRTVEVYDLSKDWDEQLAAGRVWNF